MPLSRSCRVLVLALLSSAPIYAQTTPADQADRDSGAVAAVETAIRALGGAAAISQARSWDFESQTQGSFRNQSKGETLAADKSAQDPPGTKAQVKLPPWARPHSLLIPALAGQILVKQLQDSRFSIELQEPGLDGVVAVVFSSHTVGGQRFPGQVWHFDKTTGLPTRVWLREPVAVGRMLSVTGLVALSDYRAVGGVLYPHSIETILRDKQQREVITLQSMTPRAAGGVQ